MKPAPNQVAEVDEDAPTTRFAAQPANDNDAITALNPAPPQIVDLESEWQIAKQIHRTVAHRVMELEQRYQLVFAAYRAGEHARTLAALRGKRIQADDKLRERVRVMALDVQALRMQAQTCQYEELRAEQMWRASIGR